MFERRIVKLKDCDVCGDAVVKTVICHRGAFVCQNCCAKYRADGKRDERFEPLPRESWLPSRR